MSLVTTAPSYVTGQVVTAAQLNALQDGIQAAWTAYTPTVTPGGGAFTTVAGGLHYLQIGKTVLWNCVINITTVGTATGTVNFTLPVTPATPPLGTVAGIGAGRENGVSGKTVQVYRGATNAVVSHYDNTSPIAAGANIVMSGQYEAA